MRKRISLITALLVFILSFSSGTASALYLLDLKAPTITEVWAAKTIINQGEVGVFVKAVDTASGVKNASVIFKTPSGQSRTLTLQSAGGDLWSGNLAIAPTDEEGTWSIAQVSATDGWNNTTRVTSSYTLTVDKTAPNAPQVDQVTDLSVQVTGSAEIGSTVTVKKNGQSVASATTNSMGNFAIQIPKQAPGTQLVLTAVDAAGNESAPFTLTVKDVTKPEPPSIQQAISDITTEVTGTAEWKSTVKGKVNGQVVTSVKVENANGSFTLPIPEMSPGTEIQFTATDEAGNESEAIRVTVIDVTPPDQPVVNIPTDLSVAVTGKAGGYETIQVKANGNVIGTGVADGIGNFSVAIPKQAPGTQLVVISIDSSGNQSKPVTVTVKDVTRPQKPAVIQNITDQTRQISGTAEANATIKVTANNAVLATAKADANGSFTVALPSLQGIGEIQITATDDAGNISDPLVKAVADVTPPGDFVLTESITDQSTQIFGTADAGSTVVITFNEKYVIGQVKVGDNKTLNYEIPKLPAGSTLTFVVKDQAGNQSQPVIVKVALKISFPVLPAGTPKKTFTDLGNVPWAKDAIEEMATLGVINGVSANSYNPDSNVTRAEFAKMIIKTLGIQGENLYNPFEDVKEGDWYYTEVLLAAKYGIVKGVSPVEFAPNQLITRQEMATMIVRAMQLVQPVQANNVEGTLKAFKDQSAIANWARENAAIAVEKGLIKGVSVDAFAPATNTTRAQAAVMISRFYHLYK